MYLECFAMNDTQGMPIGIMTVDNIFDVTETVAAIIRAPHCCNVRK